MLVTYFLYYLFIIVIRYYKLIYKLLLLVFV